MPLQEYQVYQNHVLGAHIIWEFTKSFSEHSKEKDSKYPTLYQVLPVLPLCLNRRVVEGIKNRTFKEGSLLKAIDDNKDLFSGLQERMESMAAITFNSIYLASQARLIIYDNEKFLLISNSITIPTKVANKLYEDYKDILKASRRLGSWFSQLTTEEISVYFNINY